MNCHLQRVNLTTNSSDLRLDDLPNTPFLIGYILLIAFNAVVSVFVISANTGVIYTILRTPSLQSPSNYLILGLAIADFGIGVLVQPSFYVWIACMLAEKNKCFEFSSLISRSSTWALITASCWTIGALTTDRFIAIKHHLRYREIVTSRRTGVVYSIICICAIITGVSRSLPSIVVLLFDIFTVLIFIVTIYLMAKIQSEIRRHSRQIQVQNQQQNVNIQRMKKNMYVMYYITGTLVVCYLPSFICSGLSDFINATSCWSTYIFIFTISDSLLYLNSLLNPMIYFWRIEELKNAAQHLLKRTP